MNAELIEELRSLPGVEVAPSQWTLEPTEQNRKAWDEIHRRRTQAMAGQLGIPEKIRELLPDISGKHVLHLQCATGESTADLVELGALVSAVDISAEALDVARELAPDVAYVHADVQELPLEIRRARFDVVYTGGGADLASRPRSLGNRNRLSAETRRNARPVRPPSDRQVVDPLGHWRDDYFDDAPLVTSGSDALRADRRAGHGGEARTAVAARPIVEAITGAGLGVTRLVEFQTLYKWLQRDRRVPLGVRAARGEARMSEAKSPLLPRLRRRTRRTYRARRERPAQPLHRREQPRSDRHARPLHREASRRLRRFRGGSEKKRKSSPTRACSRDGTSQAGP